MPVDTAKNTVTVPVLRAGFRTKTSVQVVFGRNTAPELVVIEKVPSLLPVRKTFSDVIPSPMVMLLFAMVAVMLLTVPVPAAFTVAVGIILPPAGLLAGL